MRFQMLEEVVLTRDLPEHRLRVGDVGTVVHVYEPEGVEVEFMTAAGETAAVVTLSDADVRRPDGDDFPAVRRLSPEATH